MKTTGHVIGGIGLALTLYDMKVNASNYLDFTMGVVSFIPGIIGWILGGAYFIGNAYMQATTGESIGQYLQNQPQRIAESYQCKISNGLD